ncbi:MAG: hypothetical protein ACYCYE_01225 [Clostridia bacterium]
MNNSIPKELYFKNEKVLEYSPGSLERMQLVYTKYTANNLYQQKQFGTE